MDGSRRGLLRFALRLAVSIGLPAGVLLYVQMSPVLVLRLQPDLGWALVVGVATGVLDAALRNLIEAPATEAGAAAPAQAG